MQAQAHPILPLDRDLPLAVERQAWGPPSHRTPLPVRRQMVPPSPMRPAVWQQEENWQAAWGLRLLHPIRLILRATWQVWARWAVPPSFATLALCRIWQNP